jgi:hypothetical protein
VVKRPVQIPDDLVAVITEIVNREGYVALQEAFPREPLPQIFLSEEEAEALITLVVIEKRKAWLKYPYYDSDHPKHSEEDEAAFDDVQMGLYEKVIYYVESAFSKGRFDALL